MEKILNYLIPTLFLFYILYRQIKFKKNAASAKKLINSSGEAQIVDVRTPQEYFAGHAKNSINIPLNEFASKLSQLDKNKPIILCCASGARSGAALAILKSQGFNNAYNAGAWSNLD